MKKYDSYKTFKDENGKIMIQFKVKNSKGEIIETEPTVLIDEQGNINQASYNKAIELASAEILEEQLKNANKKQLPSVVPENVVVNKNANAWKKGLAVVGGVVLAGLLFWGIGEAVKNKENKETVEPSVTTEQTIEPVEEKDEIKTVVEDTVVNLTVDDVEKIAYEAGKYLNEDLKLNISQHSINAVTYIMNQENGIDEVETKELIDAGFISADVADVFPATLETTNEINRNNALTTEDASREVISYSIFAANKRTKELCDAFAEDIKENQVACAELNGGKQEYETNEAYEARMELNRKAIWSNWESYESYGGLNEKETYLPYAVTQGDVASQWVSLQQIQPYSAAYAKSGLGLTKEDQKAIQARINFANGIGNDASKVFVDFSTMYNVTAHNLGEACNVEIENSKSMN